MMLGISASVDRPFGQLVAAPPPTEDRQTGAPMLSEDEIRRAKETFFP
jgi:hypothetical protein